MSDNGSRADAAVYPMPDRDLVDLAYACALDAMAASEQYETMTRLDSADAITRRKFDAIVQDVRETMAVTADSVRTPPPAALRTRILDALGDTEQVATHGNSTHPDVIPIGRSRRRTVRLVAAAAAVVAVAIGGTVAIQQATGPDTTVVQAASLQSAVTGGGTMTVSYSPGASDATVTMSGVAPPPAGSVYQLWLIDGTPVSAGVMDTTTESVRVAGGEALSVTVEPVGGSEFPTSAAVARVDLT